MAVWVVAVSVALAIAIVGGVFFALRSKSVNSEKASDEQRLTEMRSDNLEQSVSNLMAAQSELAGRLSQLAEAQTRSQAGMMKSLEERLDGVKLYMGRSLTEQSDRTSSTLHQLHTRLSMIDEAHRTISELSTNVTSLQDMMGGNRARGVFGEMQMRDLVTSSLPPSAYTFQKTLANGRTADCLIELPNPPGPMVIDARFPMESYHMLREAKTDEDKAQAERTFRNAVLKHVVDIAERYIVAGDTAESALMFLPSEAVYAELHANFPDVVEKSFRARVWIVSPTTMMATLNTVRAVLKDARMREQAQIIHRETGLMLDDVSRLQKRVLNLQAHFGQAEKDVREVLIAADKIARRAERIEEVQIGSGDTGSIMEYQPAVPQIEAKAELPVVNKVETPIVKAPVEKAPLAKSESTPKPSPVASAPMAQKAAAPRAFTPKMAEPPKAESHTTAPKPIPKKEEGESRDPASVWANLWLSAMTSKKDKAAKTASIAKPTEVGTSKVLKKAEAIVKPKVQAAKVPNAFLPDPATVKAGKEAAPKAARPVPNATAPQAAKAAAEKPKPKAENLSFADIAEDLAEFGVPLASLAMTPEGRKEKSDLKKLSEAPASKPETAAKAASDKKPASKLYPAGLNPFVAPAPSKLATAPKKLPVDSKIELPKSKDAAPSKPVASAGHAIYFPAMSLAPKTDEDKRPYVKNEKPKKDLAAKSEAAKRLNADETDFDDDSDDRPTIWPLV